MASGVPKKQKEKAQYKPSVQMRKDQFDSLLNVDTSKYSNSHNLHGGKQRPSNVIQGRRNTIAVPHAYQLPRYENAHQDTGNSIKDKECEAIQKRRSDFKLWCKKNNLEPYITQRLKAEELDNLEILKEFPQEQIRTLNLNREQNGAFKTALNKLQNDYPRKGANATNPYSAESKKTAPFIQSPYALAFEQFLEELLLDKTTISKLKRMGIDCPEALMLLENLDVDAMKLSPNQATSLKELLSKLKIRDRESETHMNSGAHSLTKTSRFISRKLRYGTEAKQEKDDFCEAIYRFVKSTDTARKPGMANAAAYLKSNGNGKLEKGNSIHGMINVKLPVQQTYEDTTNKVRKCILGKEKCTYREKTIMVVGATGVGKSTLIDGICNYLFDVKWGEYYRFRLIDAHTNELKNATVGPSVSQTEWITIYTIHSDSSNKLPYTLNVIDTPGFGDTRGISRDEKLVVQIGSLFKKGDGHGINELDAVCFVARAPDARLTPTQRYIFHSISSLFGKDIEGNIMAMITFADAGKAPVIEAMTEGKVPYSKAFTFNNSALFANNGSALDQIPGQLSVTFIKMFWNMGMDSFKTFFSSLEKLTPKNIRLSSEVLDQRQNLKQSLVDLEEKVYICVSTMVQLEEDAKLFSDNLRQIKKNSSLKSTFAHYTSRTSNDTVTSLEEAIKGTAQTYERTEDAVRTYVRQRHNLVQSLQHIALKSESMTEIEYIEHLIETEERKQRDGWEQKAAQLKKIKMKYI